MKKITFLIILFVSSLAISQELVTNGDFETGAAAPWYGNAANVVFENSNNYNSANVETAGASHAVNLSQKGISITAGKTYRLQFDAWSDGSRTMIAGIGLSADPWTSKTETINLTNTSDNYSILLVANFTNADSRVLFDMGADTGFVGIDNVSLQEVAATCSDGVQNGDETGIDCGGSCSPCGATPAPTDAPTTPPTRDAADVISIYGEAYGAAIGLNNVGWDGTSNAVEETHASNKVLKIDFETFIGTDLGSAVDASTMTHFHMDYWIGDDPVTDGAVFNTKWSNHDDMKEINSFLRTIPVVDADKQKWISLDIPISGFETGDATRDNLKQFLIDVAGKISLAYLDNVYFYKESGDGGGGGSTEIAVPPATPTFTTPADVVSLFRGVDDISATTNAFAGATVEDVNLVSGNGKSNGDLVKKMTAPTPGGGFQFVTAPQDLSAFTHMYVNLYVAGTVDNGEIFQIFVQGGGANLIYNINPNDAAVGTDKWVTLTVPFADFTNSAQPRNSITNFQFVAAGGDSFGPIYIDNVSFYKAGTLSTKNNDLFESSVYPNPTVNNWTIDTPNTKIKTIELFNIIGKQVYRATVNETKAVIPTRNLTSGIYFAKVNTEAGTKSIKLIKE